MTTAITPPGYCGYCKPGGGPTQFKGSRGHSGDAQLQENGRPRKSTFEDPPPFLPRALPGCWGAAKKCKNAP